MALDRKEIDIEIARLEYGESSYPAYSKLADLYTIIDRMDRAEAAKKAPEPQPKVSMSAPDPVLFDGDSEFMRAIKGKDSAAVWAVIDDLMDTLHVTMPRAYNGVMRRIKDL